MKLGITMPTRTVALERVPEYARWAEEGGFDSAWTWELYRNPFSMLVTSALATDRISLGTGLAVAGSRSPFEMANEAADIDEISGGRMLLGVGTGISQFLKAFHSMDITRPLTHLSEYIDVLRLSWQYLRTGEAPAYSGSYLGFSPPPVNPWGLRHIEREQIPIYLGAIGPKMLDLTGAKADGWISYLATPSYISERVRPLIAEGASAAGRDIADVDMMLERICVISDDEDHAMRMARKQVGFYVSHPYSDTMVEHVGFQDEVNGIRELARSEGIKAFERASDDLVRAFSITGTPDQARKQLAEWEGIVDHLVLHTPYVPPFEAEESEFCYRNIIDTFGRPG